MKDIAGVDEVKERIIRSDRLFKNPKKYQDLGIFLPKGVLLIGPPGVGKTMIAKALASEARVPFFTKAGRVFSNFVWGWG